MNTIVINKTRQEKNHNRLAILAPWMNDKIEAWLINKPTGIMRVNFDIIVSDGGVREIKRNISFEDVF